MYLLGIGGLGYKDSAAALLFDGRVVAAAAEERFTGVKHEGGFPHRAVAYCLDRAGVNIRECGYVAVANNPWLAMRDKVLKWYGEDFLKSRTSKVYHIFKDESHRLVEYLKELDDIAAMQVPVQTVPHHMSHLAAAFFASPFDSAAVVSVDGRGELSTSGFGHGRGSELEVQSVVRMPHSLGLLYAVVADFLGFSDLDDEFRVISISTTGTPTLVPQMREVVRLAGDGSYTLNPEYFGYHEGRAYLSERFTEVFGEARDPSLPMDDRHRDIAASLHAVVLEVVLAIAKRVRERTGESRLCLGGGLIQNWALVGAICESGLFDEIYVPPAAGDEGTAIGAALAVHHTELKLDRSPAMWRADLGPSYPADEIAAEISRLKLHASKPADLAEAAAEKIAGGGILGWFQGRAEFGPRALGHRSILADPTDPGTRATLVRSVKARSEFHPFGLSVAAETVGEFFEGTGSSPFLERTFHLRDGAREKLPAVAAAEGRARVHTVDKERDPQFHSLLLAVKARTGVPAVLNTSLNEAGRPMATTPREAIGCLYTSGLDALAIGPFLLAK